jgi:uncharacterized protein (UPF0261 family)
MQPLVYAIATMDTKAAEIDFVAQLLRSEGIATRTIDVGTLDPPARRPDVSREQVLGERNIAGLQRGPAVTTMGEALRDYLLEQHRREGLAGVVGIGGSGGTALITTALRALPIGTPKVMVSTVASGNTGPYVDGCDITMVYSVVDVAGLNAVSRVVLGNAARALAGMVRQPATSAAATKPALGMTMFGVTTPCVTRVREHLEGDGFDALVFHATGTGGRAMEKLVESGMIRGVLDITTTEVTDEVVGGVFPAGAERFDRLLEAEIPLVLSLGAVDMVNFGALDSVPAPFRNRQLHVHNAQVTLMRTNADENRQIARWLTGKLNRSTAPLTMVVPEGGLSALDAPGQPFADADANAALFEELQGQWKTSDERRLVWSPLHINQPEFADLLVAEFELLRTRSGAAR